MMDIVVAKTYTQTYITCPHCEQQTGSRVDHLFSSAPTSFGPWYCDVCGFAYNGIVHKRDYITLDKLSQSKTKTQVLLKLEPQTKPIYFIVDHASYPNISRESDKSYFEEHSCPSNWFRNITNIMSDSDSDPHGLLTYVDTVLLSEQIDDPFDLFKETKSNKEASK